MRLPAGRGRAAQPGVLRASGARSPRRPGVLRATGARAAAGRRRLAGRPLASLASRKRRADCHVESCLASPTVYETR